MANQVIKFNSNKTVLDYWENCGLTYAHLVEKGWRKKKDYINEYKKYILNDLNVNLEDSTILDYGCGGGFLGEYLFEEYKIKKYIGIDISKRSIDYAKKRLKGNRAKFYLGSRNFRKIKANIFFSFSCIQHINDEAYILHLLRNINQSGIKIICLHYRYGKNIKFINQYEKNGDIGRCSLLNNDYIDTYLRNYKLINKSKIFKNGTQSLIYEL